SAGSVPQPAAGVLPNGSEDPPPQDWLVPEDIPTSALKTGRASGTHAKNSGATSLPKGSGARRGAAQLHRSVAQPQNRGRRSLERREKHRAARSGCEPDDSGWTIPGAAGGEQSDPEKLTDRSRRKAK